MSMTDEERNGVSARTDVREASDDFNSPSVQPESPIKQVVFRSKDKGLALYQKAGYTDKSHGIASYVPSTGIQFNDHEHRVDDIPENAKHIDWMRNHESFGIAFIEVPRIADMPDLPVISKMQTMTNDTLKELCEKRNVTISDNARKDEMILALLKDQLNDK